MFTNEQLITAFTLTLLAGLSTGIGAALVLFVKNPSKKFLSAGLGFSAGVMLYVSFMEILPSSISELTKIYSPKSAEAFALLAFFCGIGLSAAIDRLTPTAINPHEFTKDEDVEAKNRAFLKKTGLVTAAAIAIHNFPEGFATFLFSVAEPNIAIVVASAIAIHNIPEGIAVALPIYMATKERGKAFWLSFASGFAEPLGALVGFFALTAAFGTGALIGLSLAAVAGIMVYVCLDELLPSSRVYGNEHIAILGVTAGMAVMGVSILMMK